MSNRLIKFRAWDIERKVMFDVSGLDNTGSYDRCWGMRPDGERYYTPNAVLMQFTGVCDKNGREIYEGDILEFDKYEWNRSPVLSREDIEKLPPFYFAVTWGKGQWEGAGCYSDWPVYCAIVGNIHANPGLVVQLG